MSFALAINCIDGRVQEPVITYLKKELNVKYIDMITEPGVVKFLSDDTDSPQVEAILEKASISTTKHGSSSIAVVAHYDCAANQISDDLQKQQLAKAVAFIKSKFDSCNVFGLWVDSGWDVQPL